MNGEINALSGADKTFSCQFYIVALQTFWHVVWMSFNLLAQKDSLSIGRGEGECLLSFVPKLTKQDVELVEIQKRKLSMFARLATLGYDASLFITKAVVELYRDWIRYVAPHVLPYAECDGWDIAIWEIICRVS